MISSNHVFLTSSTELKEMSKPLEKYGIHYFNYTRSEASGRRVYLVTHPHVLENYLAKKFHQVGNCETSPQNYESQIVLWSTLPKQFIYQEARMMGVDHGAFLIKKHDNFVEFFSFATRPGNHSIVNFYLNNLDFLQKFAESFKEKSQSIIKQAEKVNFILPFHNEKISCYKAEDIAKEKCRDVALTERQFTCIRLMTEGKSAKEIGLALNLSQRTVEAYIQRVKEKWRCKNKSELIAKFLKLDRTF